MTRLTFVYANEIYVFVLGMGIVLIYKRGNDCTMSTVENNENPGKFIIVSKNGEHYDSIVLAAGGVSPGVSRENDNFGVRRRLNSDSVNANRISSGIWPKQGTGINGTGNYGRDLNADTTMVGQKCSSTCIPFLSAPIDITVSCRQENCIEFCLWNINGLSQDKLHDKILGKYLSRFDIILRLETWSDGESSYELHDYKYFDFNREYRHAKVKRASGGIGVFIKSYLCNAVEIFRNCSDTVVWLKF